MTTPESTTPVERAADVLHRHIHTTLATVAAGLPSSRAMRDVTGVTASCEAAVLGEIANGGPLTRQGLDIAVHRAFVAACGREEFARAMDPDAFADHPVEARREAAALQWGARRAIAFGHADALIAHLTAEAAR